MALALAGCAKPLPEAGTPAAQLYASRCGSCHRLYHPGSLTAAMWQVQVHAMQAKMRDAGVAALTVDQQEEILDYLERNAEHPQ
jgi:hypothetical protein